MKRAYLKNEVFGCNHLFWKKFHDVRTGSKALRPYSEVSLLQNYPLKPSVRIFSDN